MLSLGFSEICQNSFFRRTSTVADSVVILVTCLSNDCCTSNISYLLFSNILRTVKGRIKIIFLLFPYCFFISSIVLPWKSCFETFRKNTAKTFMTGCSFLKFIENCTTWIISWKFSGNIQKNYFLDASRDLFWFWKKSFWNTAPNSQRKNLCGIVSE